MDNKKTEVVYPKDGEKVYYVKASGEVAHFFWVNNDYNKKIFNFGNCFDSEEVASVVKSILNVFFGNYRYGKRFN